MNESKSNVPNMYQTIPAVAALNRVPGFEPMKFLRPAMSRKTGEKVMKLALPYKKLWFLLAHPKGRIMVNRLRITEKMAIFEARVYLDRSDSEPISSFTSCCMFDSETKNNYVEDAQEEAISKALSLAGYGLQFADVEMTKEAERFGCEIPMSAVSDQQVNDTPAKEVVIKTAEPPAERLPVEVKEEEEKELPVAPVMEKPVEEESEDSLPIAPVETTEQEESQDKPSATQRAMQILQGRGNVANFNAATPPVSAVKKEEVQAAEPPKYTKSTPVPEILKLMTFEEAQNVVVDVGTCNGKTIQEVADTRPAVLKYYQFGGYKGGNNILIAAATIMYNHLESQKMGKAG